MADFEALVTVMFEMVGYMISMATIDCATPSANGRIGPAILEDG